MQRSFNTAGPCAPDRDYMLPALRRLPLAHGLIAAGKYFLLHAPRQAGKTTALRTIARELMADGETVAVVLSSEVAEALPGDLDAGEQSLLGVWRRSAERQLAPEFWPPEWPQTHAGVRLQSALQAWTIALGRPFVVLLDEVDTLQGDLLMSMLRQIRSAYAERGTGFPAALMLCGMRDLRDYRVAAGQRMGTASPFNIKAESLTLRNFQRDEIAELYAQHTADTGQVFEAAAVDRAFHWTRGQPWLVNALARQAVEVLVVDSSRPITAGVIDEAKDLLIQRRDTHLDSLAERLREPRVRRVIEPILTGSVLEMDVMNDDLLYARDLGLVIETPHVQIANLIYQEVIPRSLTYVMQATIVQDHAWYERADGSFDIPALLRAFQRFFAEHSESWLGRFDYQEAGPHLTLMAFLQRAVNGGGRISREFAIGSGRADLELEWRQWRYLFELKIRRGERSEDDGVAQVGRYLERLGDAEGFLIIFDRRGGVTWEQRLFEHTRLAGGRTIHVFGA